MTIWLFLVFWYLSLKLCFVLTNLNVVSLCIILLASCYVTWFPIKASCSVGLRTVGRVDRWVCGQWGESVGGFADSREGWSVDLRTAG